MGKWMKRWKIGAAAFLAAAVLAGCSQETSLFSGTKGEKEYGKPETMAVVTTERLRYEELYSDKIWTAAVDNRGTTFEASLLDQIHEFMKELKVMSLMAGEEKLSLSNREKELSREAAERYMDALGEELAGELGLDSETMEKFYGDYWLAEKLVEKLTGDADLEVSDSEAKVIDVSQIVLEDQETAEEVLLKVQEEGADFYAAAKAYSADPEIQKQIFRGMMGSQYEAAAYGLETGEISGVVEDSGKYYIIKCDSDYNESATRVHKEEMIQEKRNQAFYSAYQTFKDETVLTGDEELWETVSITGSPRTEADFFGIFEDVCREKGPEGENG